MTRQPSRTPFAVEHLLASLTLEEKASLLSGRDFWHTQGIERDDVAIPAVMLTDGPHGLRKQAEGGDHLGLGASVPATCFPTASALGSTWDVDLLTRVGAALGLEARAADVAVLLGPGANIKRDPRCGRNFEYLSEDPVLSGDLAAALIRGIQSRGVGASLKHFAVNNQESDRMRVSAEVDDRALREIYLASFERAVTQSDPWTVMCSYNRVNGTYASQNRFLLTQVLREEWGWDGLVVSDWGAVRDRVASLAAGLDLEMPSSDGRTDADVVAAVHAGALDEAVVDAAVRNVLRLLDRAIDAVETPTTFDADAHHALAREAAAAAAVLLRNEPVDGAPLLPLGTDRSGVVVLGEFARTPRYQGAGSSLVDPTRLDTALDALRAALDGEVPFAPAFTIPEGPETDTDAQALLTDAVALADGAGTVLLFLGLPAADESEGYDRTTMSLPDAQLRVLEAVAAVNPRVVVVLAGGGVVSVGAWQHHAPALLESWLGGQAAGSAVADVLTGAVEPTGRLAETIPARLRDVPAWGSFPGSFGTVGYGESVMVGYRWYDTRDLAVAHPFGHGLGYTTFDIDDVTAVAHGRGSGATVEVTARVTNTGARTGAEVVQVYVSDPDAVVARPERELKAFAKISLEAGESRTVSFALDSRALAFWHPALHRWTVEGGAFVVAVGRSSRDLAAAVTLEVDGDDVALPLRRMSTIGELLANETAGPVLRPLLEGVEPALMAMADDMPAIVLADFGMAGFDAAALDALVERANAARE